MARKIRKQTPKGFTLLQLLAAANAGYPDGFLSTYYNEKTGKEIRGASGDTLALFIVRELKDTFSPGATDEEAVAVATHTLENAIRDLQRTIDALDESLVFRCKACGREEGLCSANPCESVIADRIA